MAHQPVGDSVEVAAAGTSATSAAQSQRTNSLRVVAVTNAACVAIGEAATTANYYIPGDTASVINLGAVRSQRVVSISTAAGSTGGLSDAIIDVPEGTGCQFAVGDKITLTCTGQSWYDFTYKEVESVNTTAGVNGYFATRFRVADAYSVGFATAFTDNQQPCEVRASFKVSAIKCGSSNATIKFQQVQVSGDA